MALILCTYIEKKK